LNEHPGDYANFNSYQPRDGTLVVLRMFSSAHPWRSATLAGLTGWLARP